MDYANRFFDRMHRLDKGYVTQKLRSRNKNNSNEFIWPAEWGFLFAKQAFFCYKLGPMVQRNT